MDALNLIVLRHLVNLPWPGTALGQELATLEIGVGPTRAENGEGQFPTGIWDSVKMVGTSSFSAPPSVTLWVK